jgi:hypothetical protein
VTDSNTKWGKWRNLDTKNGDGWRSSELGDLNWDHKYWICSWYITSWTTRTLKKEEARSYRAVGTTCQVTYCHPRWTENLYFEKDGSQMFSFYFWKYSLQKLYNWVLENYVCVFVLCVCLLFAEIRHICCWCNLYIHVSRKLNPWRRKLFLIGIQTWQ